MFKTTGFLAPWSSLYQVLAMCKFENSYVSTLDLSFLTWKMDTDQELSVRAPMRMD